jgi:hypothetical protein
MPVQWAHLGRGRVLVASEREARVQRLELGAIGFARPMRDALPGTLESTRQLLDGAIAAAELDAPPSSPAPITAARWAWHLANQSYCARHSVALLPVAIDRFEAIGRPDLAGFAQHKLDEEIGHDQFPLNDLEELGYDAEEAVSVLAPAPSVSAGLEYARGCLESGQPVEFLGYVYALERQVLRLTDEWFSALDAVLPPGINAASGVRSHATELDGEHVREATAFIAGLPASDRAAIATGCNRITEIYCEPFEPPSEAELAARLACVRHERPATVRRVPIN